MNCKLAHDEDGIPKYLCRTCNPDKFKPVPAVEVPSDAPDYSKLRKKRALQKLHVEEKRLRKLADDIGHHQPDALKKVYAALLVVEKEISKVERA